MLVCLFMLFNFRLIPTEVLSKVYHLEILNKKVGTYKTGHRPIRKFPSFALYHRISIVQNSKDTNFSLCTKICVFFTCAMVLLVFREKTEL